MEILESIAWITLGFVPVFGSMELAWRLPKKLVVSKSSAEGETHVIEESPHPTKLQLQRIRIPYKGMGVTRSLGSYFHKFYVSGCAAVRPTNMSMQKPLCFFLR
jgi:hypothetical protein